MNRFSLIFITVLIVVGVFASTALIVMNFRQDNIPDLASACPKKYENNLLEFQYPCSWLLTENRDDELLVFTTFHKTTNQKIYLWFDFDADTFSTCESGEHFSENELNVLTVTGDELEACHHLEHGGETLTIQTHEGYIDISSEGGLIDEIKESLRIH